MAKALVLGALKTTFLGLQSILTATGRTVAVPLSNRVLKGAWMLCMTNNSARPVYGTILARVASVGDVTAEGILLASGWFGEAAIAAAEGGDEVAAGTEGIAWYGELPVFEDRPIRLSFTIRNDSGATVDYTGGYAWQDFEENDRPS